MTDDGLDRIADFCRAGLPRLGVDAISVTFGTAPASSELLVATDDLAERVAQLEFTLGEGPATDAATSCLPTSVDDLGSAVGAHRWPIFAAEALELGVHAVQAYPIVFSRRAFGVVGMYGCAPTRFTSRQHRQAVALTELVGLALVDDGSSATIGPGLRMTVHQAAGMVMQQTGSSVQDALVLLRSTAFNEDVRVTDLASDVLAGRRRFGEARKT